MANDHLRESQILLEHVVSALSVLNSLLCDYSDGVPLESTGMHRLLSQVEGEARGALAELRVGLTA